MLEFVGYQCLTSDRGEGFRFSPFLLCLVELR